MSNNKYKIIFLFLTLIMIMLISPPYFKAEENATEIELIVKSHIQETIALIPDTTWTDATEISMITPTYILEQKVNGYIAELATNGIDTGYIQIRCQNESMKVISYTFEGTHYTNAIKEKLYYLGNLNFDLPPRKDLPGILPRLYWASKEDYKRVSLAEAGSLKANSQTANG